MIIFEPCQNSTFDAPEGAKVRLRFRYQNPTPRIRKIGGVNKWYVQWRDSEGTKRSKVLGRSSEMTRSEAIAAVAVILASVNVGKARPTSHAYTFAEYVENMYIPFQIRGWKTSSAGTAIQQIRSHLLPALGEKRLDNIAIQRMELQTLLDLKAEQHSRSVVSHLRWFLNAICKLAVSDGILQFNPAAELIVPRCCRRGREPRVLTIDQIEIYIQALGLRERVAALLALIEGMRPGEFLARRWPEMTRESICVATRVYRGEFDKPKSGKEREGGMSDGTWEALDELREGALDPEGYVFASETGHTPISRDNLWRRYMKPALDRVGLGWATFQVLRRTNASISKKEGIDPKVAADQRGHGLGVSMEHYTQSDLEQKRDAVRKLERAVFPKRKLKRTA